VETALSHLVRWQSAAAQLGGPGTPLAVELAELAHSPTPKQLARAAAAARFAASQHEGDARDLAVRIADELDVEVRARRSP
jgi:hypothetical protein